MYDILLGLLAIYALYGRKHKGLDDGMKIILWLIVEHTAMSNCLNKINSKKKKKRKWSNVTKNETANDWLSDLNKRKRKKKFLNGFRVVINYFFPFNAVSQSSKEHLIGIFDIFWIGDSDMCFEKWFRTNCW